MKRIVILSNHDVYTYNFRKEIIQALLDKEYEVYVVLPYGKKVELLRDMGCNFIEAPLNRHSVNPFKELQLLNFYRKTLKRLKPDLVLSYTIKPNLYGGMICRFLNIPFIPNITGLGSAVEKDGLLQKVTVSLYKIAFKKANCVFFQNAENQKFFRVKGIGIANQRLIPGSGVNLEHFSLLEYPPDDVVEFAFISRIMKEKGIDQYLEAARNIRNQYPNTRFHILGFCEEAYEETLKEMQERGIVEYHGMVNDIRGVLRRIHCIIHPSYYAEGISNVLLESAACGRPVITTNRSGCRETVTDGVSGLLVKQRDSFDLIEKIEQFLKFNYQTKKKMGMAARRKVEEQFNRSIVVESYMEEIRRVALMPK